MLTYLIYKGETQMTTDELKELLKSIQKNKCENQVLELKRLRRSGCLRSA